MKLPLWNPPRLPCVRSKLTPAAVLVFGLFLGTLDVRGQAVFSPPTPIDNTPPAFPQAPQNDSAPATPQAASSPFQWGFVTAHPHMSYRYLYGNGIQSTPGNQTKTSINAISLGVLLNVGSHWTLDYTPTQTYYSDRAFKDTFDQSVRLLGATTYENWSFQLAQSYSSTDTPLIETGQQTSEDDYSTNATAGYHFNERVQLDTNLSYVARYTTVYPDSKETTVGERLHYKFLPTVDTSVNLDYGSVNMSSGTDMNYTRPGAQVNWQATDKTSFNLQAGWEHRTFRDSGTDSLNSPTFAAGLHFQPTTTTSINLSTNRGVATAYFTDQITRNTAWQVDIQQRLLQHYYLSAGYSDQKSTYLSTDPTVVAGRDDKSHSFNVRLSTTFFERAEVAILYQDTHNDSNNSGFAFDSRQVGMELSYRY